MDYISRYDSPMGPLTLKSDGLHLTGLAPALDGTVRDDLPVFAVVRVWLDRYFRGEWPNPGGLPLSPSGTDFQKLIWDKLLEIPCGETRSYGDIARAMGKPRACQAVGQAVGRNPIGIIIPCHRIIGSDGTLTGFAWGLEWKRRLLRHEAQGG